MTKLRVLEEGIGDFVRPKNTFESQGESIQDSCKTSNDVRGRDLGSEESTREEVGCGGNEDVKMDEWSHQAGQNRPLARWRQPSKQPEACAALREFSGVADRLLTRKTMAKAVVLFREVDIKWAVYWRKW